MATTIFRIEKKSNYTVVSNYHLQDKGLSLKAKGMLTLMLSLPEDWDYTLNGLVSLSKDGKDSVRATIKELEENGYLTRHRPRNELGQLLCTEYTIREISTKAEGYNNAEAQINADTSVPENTQDGTSNVVQMAISDLDKKAI